MCNVQKNNNTYYHLAENHVIIICNRGGVFLENKTLELMEKIYKEMQHGFSELRHDIDGIKEDVSGMKVELAGVKEDVSGMKVELAGVKEDVSGMKVELTGVKQELTEVKQRVINIENNHGKKLSALFDGYKQNSDKLDRIQEEVSKHEEIILRRVK